MVPRSSVSFVFRGIEYLEGFFCISVFLSLFVLYLCTTIERTMKEVQVQGNPERFFFTISTRVV